MWILSEFSNTLVNLSNVDSIFLDEAFYKAAAVIAIGRGTDEDNEMYCVLFCDGNKENAHKYFSELTERMLSSSDV